MYSKDYYESADYNPEVIGIDIFKKMNLHIPCMVFILQAPGFKLLYANRKVFEFSGFSEHDLRKMDAGILEMMDPEDAAKMVDAVSKLDHTEDDQAMTVRVKLKAKDGRLVHLDQSISVFKRKENGMPAAYLCVAEKILPEDHAGKAELINIQKNLEAKIAELAKAYEEMEEFAYIASHDLQEPLRKISVFSERLQEKCGNNMHADCAVYLDRILNGTSRMRILIDNLLTLSRTKRKADYIKPTNLDEILSEVMVDLETKIASKSAVIKTAALPIIDAIPTQMHQLFLNLLSNSLKFTKEESIPVIQISNSHLIKEEEKNEYNLDIKQDYIHILFQDNGIGFDSSFADVIFSPFKRLHGRAEYEGTGIGLAICKKVVQNHLGIIWATSTPDNGAVFNVILALRQPGDDSKH